MGFLFLLGQLLSDRYRIDSSTIDNSNTSFFSFKSKSVGGGSPFLKEEEKFVLFGAVVTNSSTHERSVTRVAAIY